MASSATVSAPKSARASANTSTVCAGSSSSSRWCSCSFRWYCCSCSPICPSLRWWSSASSNEVHRQTHLCGAAELHLGLYPQRLLPRSEPEPLLHGRFGGADGAGAAVCHHPELQVQGQQVLPWCTVLPLPHLRHLGGLHLQVLLHPRLCAGYPAELGGFQRG